MDYPDIKAIVSGRFAPLDESRCLVCGKELKGQESTCGESCFTEVLNIQRDCSEAMCDQIVEAARKNNDPRLIG